MALLQYTDIASALKLDLSLAANQTIVSNLIAAAVEFADGIVDFSLEEVTVTEYFEDGHQRLWLNTSAPVTGLTIAQYNSITSAFDDIDSQYVRHTGDNQVYVTVCLPSGFQSVRASYTTGWTAASLPADLKQALIDLVGHRYQEVSNYATNPDDPSGDGSGAVVGALKRVEAVDYTEEYFAAGNEAQWKAKVAQLSRTIGDGVPDHILNTITQYRRPFAV